MNNEIYYTCDNCGQSFYEVENKKNLKCPFCSADDTYLHGSISVEQYEREMEMEETEYVCNNCYEHFTGKELNENGGKCPHCNMKQEELEKANEEETELDYEISNEDWENI